MMIFRTCFFLKAGNLGFRQNNNKSTNGGSEIVVDKVTERSMFVEKISAANNNKSTQFHVSFICK